MPLWLLVVKHGSCHEGRLPVTKISGSVGRTRMAAAYVQLTGRVHTTDKEPSHKNRNARLAAAGLR
ncbi:hypothetical protein SAV14893_086820 [Streptomyces avermitilis]|uniref:Uncharacterized protein n=1 Tax=Streptomyces avermitilis TaxID=33903 RepID=A0A4D4N4S7_STRAX|nr:hypothetical protein SAV14893_086820 [Streptomyces avermitilis]GDY79542.1 hypothetical protein SAV31267_090270 [Streptomyces avermitilis]